MIKHNIIWKICSKNVVHNNLYGLSLEDKLIQMLKKKTKDISSEVKNFLVKEKVIFDCININQINSFRIKFCIPSIFKFGLSVCLFVSNKRQNGRTDRAQIFCGTSREPREGLWIIKISNISLYQNSIVIKFF